jgi:signal transduction histidine kinase
MFAKASIDNQVDFKMLFESLPALFLVFRPDKDYTIVAASDTYLAALARHREDTIGKALFSVFQANPDDPDKKANQVIDDSIKRLLKSRKPDDMPTVKYDVTNADGELEIHYWKARNTPVLDASNEVIYIVHQAENVTAAVQAEQRSEEMIRIAMAELDEKSRFIKDNQQRLNKILETLLRYIVLDFSEKISISDKGDELDAIVAGLNTLSEELESHIDKLETSSGQLEAVNKELESFSYSVSHDLRSPLRAIDGYARIMEEDYKDALDAEGKRLLGVIQYNAKRMGMLIDDLLAFSRLGKKELQRSEINMKELIEGAVGEIERSTSNRAEIRYGTLHPLKADYALINQVIVNLVSNAIKYSSKNEQPVVKISSELKDGNVIYSISDNGVGFNMDYAHKLFGVFQRLHTMEEFEGTGVGLAIVQRVVTKHGGKVWADAVVGKGATFYFSIPVN